MFRTTVGYVSVYRLRVSPTNHVSTSDILCPHDVAKTACYVRPPNISGEGDWLYGGYASTGKFTGAMYHVSLQNLSGSTGGNDYYGGKPGIGIDASRSSSTYGNASTVQPSSVRLILCVKA